MNTEEIASYFERLGKAIVDYNNEALDSAIRKATLENSWFDRDSIEFSLQTWNKALNKTQIEQWLDQENLRSVNSSPKKAIGIVMAGNIPLVGLHDLLCVLISGNKAIVKSSSDDKALMDFVIGQLQSYSDYFIENIVKAERLNDIDAIIATGSNNTSRYFEHYFKHIPHLIRKNRNSIALFHGDESEKELTELGKDIFTYYGLGCRNVTHLMFPQNYSVPHFLDQILEHEGVMNHNKYANNYTYHKALFLMNKQEHLDTNFILLKPSDSIYAPIGSLSYSFYSSLDEAEKILQEKQNEIQVVVSQKETVLPSVKFGKAQETTLLDYADNVNTIQFCKDLT